MVNGNPVTVNPHSSMATAVSRRPARACTGTTVYCTGMVYPGCGTLGHAGCGTLGHAGVWYTGSWYTGSWYTGTEVHWD